MRLILSPTILEQVTNLRLSDHTKLQREAPTAYLSYTELPAALNWFVKNAILSFEPLRYVSKKTECAVPLVENVDQSHKSECSCAYPCN